LPLHHLAVVVADLERAEAFYVGLLGLGVLRRWTDAAGSPRSVWVRLGEGSSFLALEKALESGPTRADQAPGWHCLALAIAPSARRALRSSLEAAGVVVEKETDFTFYVRDPDGNLLGFSHHPDTEVLEPIPAGIALPS
jgi:catechol 2,3-dioxygenase-like lactoylglutathione lyase family enzyme